MDNKLKHDLELAYKIRDLLVAYGYSGPRFLYSHHDLIVEAFDDLLVPDAYRILDNDHKEWINGPKDYIEKQIEILRQLHPAIEFRIVK